MTKITFDTSITIDVAEAIAKKVTKDQLEYDGQTPEEYIARCILYEMLSKYPITVDWLVKGTYHE